MPRTGRPRKKKWAGAEVVLRTEIPKAIRDRMDAALEEMNLENYAVKQAVAHAILAWTDMPRDARVLFMQNARDRAKAGFALPRDSTLGGGPKK